MLNITLHPYFRRDRLGTPVLLPDILPYRMNLEEKYRTRRGIHGDRAGDVRRPNLGRASCSGGSPRIVGLPYRAGGPVALPASLGDAWWFGTVVLFGPVWVTVYAGRSLLVIPAPWVTRRSLVVLLLAAWIGVFGIMGAARSLAHMDSSVPAEGSFPLRVMTCNVHGRGAKDWC